MTATTLVRNSWLIAPADRRNYSSEVMAAAHGQGPVEVSLPGDPLLVDFKFIRAGKELGDRFSFNQDLNAGDFVGLSWLQGAIGRGERSSAATAYLHPLLGGSQNDVAIYRPNPDVLIHTQVTRILTSDHGNGCPRRTTAELGQSTSSTRVNVTARREIIMSAGVVGTPKVLMQSGIGPAATLEALNISTILDLSSVGKN
jgi:choline dehydrogenase-like flavoprotein